MKNIISLFAILLTFFVNAQKLTIQYLKIADYDLGSNSDVEIKSHSTLDKKGNLIVYSDSWDGKNYFKYQLSQEEINKINLLVSKDLESFIKQKQLDKNQYFAGSRRFITFKVNGKIKSLCFIQPFMTDYFKDLLKVLDKKIYSHDASAIIIMPSSDFEDTKKEIIKREQIDNYLPHKAVIRQIK